MLLHGIYRSGSTEPDSPDRGLPMKKTKRREIDGMLILFLILNTHYNHQLIL